MARGVLGGRHTTAVPRHARRAHEVMVLRAAPLDRLLCEHVARPEEDLGVLEGGTQGWLAGRRCTTVGTGRGELRRWLWFG